MYILPYILCIYKCFCEYYIYPVSKSRCSYSFNYIALLIPSFIWIYNARENTYLDERYLDILQSKGPKSRRVYISRELAEYQMGYDNRIESLFPKRKSFFPDKADCPYSPATPEKNFLRFWYAAFPEKKYSGVSIRAYDFRHHFVYANMNRWLR